MLENASDHNLIRCPQDPDKTFDLRQRCLNALDDRCGGTKFSVAIDADEEINRCSHFDDTVRAIVQSLQKTANKHSMVTKVPLGDNSWDLMTTGFAALLNKADKDYLVDSVLAFIPTSTKIVLGKKQYAITDLLHLPRLTDLELTEQGVYIDVVEIGNNLLEWKFTEVDGD